MAKRITPTPTPEPTGTEDYIVTEKAPPKVAGRRVQPGDTLSLTDNQARFEEQVGHIRKVASATAKAE